MREPNRKSIPENAKKPSEKLVLLAMFDHPSKAHILSNLLYEQGILATINNENATSSFGILAGQFRSSSAEVHVFEADAEMALEVYTAWKSATQQETGVPEWTCQCGEIVDAGFEVCWNCGEPFPD